MVRWSGVQVFRWSGGLVVRAVKVFMMASVVQVVPMVQVIRLVRVVQVVRWSGGKSGQGGHPGWFVRVPPYEISVFLMNYIFFLRNEIISWGKKHSALFQTHN